MRRAGVKIVYRNDGSVGLEFADLLSEHLAIKGPKLRFRLHDFAHEGMKARMQRVAQLAGIINIHFLKGEHRDCLAGTASGLVCYPAS
jgi:hypothetical protein